MSGKNQGKVREFVVDDKWQSWKGLHSGETTLSFSLAHLY